MSFSKAKIQRFNDAKECTPSPAKYNVGLQDRIRGTFFTKSGRFIKRDSPPASDSGSVHSTPCFQTPTAPPVKKKKILGLTYSKSKSKSVVDQEQLAEKIVECSNKDAYIAELGEQIEELKLKVCGVEEQNSELQAENARIKKEICCLRSEKEEKVRDLECRNVELGNISEELAKTKREYQELRDENVAEMRSLLENFQKFQNLYKESLEEHAKQLQDKNGAIKELEEDRDRYKTLMDESEAKVMLLEENFKEVNALASMQMKEKVEEIESIWKEKLEKQEREADAILQECLKISEYSIIQCELEKNHLKSVVTEKEAECKNLEGFAARNEELETILKVLKTEKHAYEVTINTSLETIEVLKRRLFSSDRDVEQLKEELARCEEKLLKAESKCGEFLNQLHEAQLANEELEMQIESTLKITESEVNATKKDLYGKVESFLSRSQNLESQLENKTQLLNEVCVQLHDQQELNLQAQLLVDQTKSVLESLEVDNMKLERRCKVLEEQLECCRNRLEVCENEIEEAAEIRKKYIEKSGKFDELSQKHEQLLKEHQEAKSCQEELQQVKDQKAALENEIKELNQNYGELLGHQNTKQKIKHFSQMRQHYGEMFQYNVDLESKNYDLTRLVEKLKKELAESGGENKENLQSPGLKMRGKGSPAGLREKKENLASPRLLLGAGNSPGPLKEKN